MLASLALLGCGDEGGPEPPPSVQRLTEAERALVSRSESRLAAYCARRISSSGLPRAPSAEERARAIVVADELIELVERKPSAEVATGVDLRLALGDLAEDLEGANCDPEVIARLTEALGRIPG